tara:strand:- start:1437 stop:1643 length:207 start_codon:yes stop_codon:yes gene_type:complete
MSKLQTKDQETENGKQLSAGILLAVELESNFKLYSYRCIEPENYLERIDQLIKIYHAVRTNDTNNTSE